MINKIFKGIFLERSTYANIRMQNVLVILSFYFIIHIHTYDTEKKRDRTRETSYSYISSRLVSLFFSFSFFYSFSSFSSRTYIYVYKYATLVLWERATSRYSSALMRWLCIELGKEDALILYLYITYIRIKKSRWRLCFFSFFFFFQ